MEAASNSDERPDALTLSRKRLPPLLRMTWYSLNQTFRRRIAPFGLTPDQYTILRWLTELQDEQVTQRRLAEIMASDANTITSLLRRMEESGLVERRPHETDRRANCITITQQGSSQYQMAHEQAVELQHRILDALPAKRRERFLRDLEIIAATCRNELRGR